MTGATASRPDGVRRRRKARLAGLGVVGAAVYLVVAYVLVPEAWRHHEKRHPAVEDAPRVTRTADGIPGDPLNIALVGTEQDIQRAMLAARWHPADPITLKSALRIAVGVVFERPYDDAPVSNLYLWGRKEDLAFEQPVGGDPRRRHHVRFWRAKKVDENGGPLWIGAATFDTCVGLSRTTGQITHHIGSDVDAERDKLVGDLQTAGALARLYWVDGFHSELTGRNGGGDPWHTDGRLAVGVLEAHATSRPVSGP